MGEKETCESSKQLKDSKVQDLRVSLVIWIGQAHKILKQKLIKILRNKQNFLNIKLVTNFEHKTCVLPQKLK